MSPPPTDSPPTGRLCSRIEALKKELRLGLGKELFAKGYSVLEGGLDTENEGVSEGGGVSLIFWPVSQTFFLLYHSTHQNACLLHASYACSPYTWTCVLGSSYKHTDARMRAFVCV